MEAIAQLGHGFVERRVISWIDGTTFLQHLDTALSAASAELLLTIVSPDVAAAITETLVGKGHFVKPPAEEKPNLVGFYKGVPIVEDPTHLVLPSNKYLIEIKTSGPVAEAKMVTTLDVRDKEFNVDGDDVDLDQYVTDQIAKTPEASPSQNPVDVAKIYYTEDHPVTLNTPASKRFYEDPRYNDIKPDEGWDPSDYNGPRNS
jgi:hypothetical protein